MKLSSKEVILSIWLLLSNLALSLIISKKLTCLSLIVKLILVIIPSEIFTKVYL